MENEKIVLTTKDTNFNKVYIMRFLATALGLFTPLILIPFYKNPFLVIAFAILLLSIMCFIFYSAWKLKCKMRSYITLTENFVSGCSVPSYDGTSGYYNFKLKYSDILNIDIENDFIIMTSTFGKYKVYTKDLGDVVKLYISEQNLGSDLSKILFEHGKNRTNRQ